LQRIDFLWGDCVIDPRAIVQAEVEGEGPSIMEYSWYIFFKGWLRYCLSLGMFGSSWDWM